VPAPTLDPVTSADGEPARDTDRDLESLEDAERELADLERELSRVEGSDDPPGG
jgi:hypothetical protein